MLFHNRMQRYPYLAAYLRSSETTDYRWVPKIRPIVWAATVGTVGLFFFLGIAVQAVFPLIGAGIYTIVSETQYQSFKHSVRAKLEVGAIDSVGRFRTLLTQNRLHKHLSDGALLLLDQIARDRVEILSLLNSSTWNPAVLSQEYRAIRENALLASEESLLRAMHHFDASVSAKLPPPNGWDILNDFIEGFVPPKLDHRQPEPGFSQAYELAEKLKALELKLRQRTEVLKLEQSKADAVYGTSVSAPNLMDNVLNSLDRVEESESELERHLRH
jgi:hypothetical protein